MTTRIDTPSLTVAETVKSYLSDYYENVSIKSETMKPEIDPFNEKITNHYVLVDGLKINDAIAVGKIIGSK